MDRRVLAMSVALVGCAWVSVARAADDPLARGRYLVEQVGMCGDCHTPRDAMGAPDGKRPMAGGPIGFKPVAAMPVWMGDAPSLAGGRAGWSRSQLVAFLQTGLNPAGRPARPPMPGFRFDRADAEAVAAYLESIR